METSAPFAFAEAGEGIETNTDLVKGHSRIEERRTAVLRELGWLEGPRRFPGELRPCALASLRAWSAGAIVRGTLISKDIATWEARIRES